LKKIYVYKFDKFFEKWTLYIVNNVYSRIFEIISQALNVQLCTWIKTHIDKNPYVLLSPVFKDYEKHLTEIETKSAATGESGEKTNGSFGSGSSSKPLLGAVFGNNLNPEPVKFGSGGSGFSFGSSTTTKSGGTETKSTSGFTFGGSSDVKPVSESGTGSVCSLILNFFIDN
jgi:nuclear pore complex protein Nup50